MSFMSSFKFFHKSLRRIKSFVSCCGCGNYQKLPKHYLSPLDDFPQKESKEVPPASRLEVRRSRGERNHGKTPKRADSGGMNGEVSGLVVRELRELELLDLGNIEHVLDVEEVIHYYSLLKCPVYRGIVDSFFEKIFVEFHGNSAAASDDNSCR